MIAERELLARFEKVKRQADGSWLASCRCSVHRNGDRHPSLHLTLTTDRWLLDCKAGGDIEDVMASARLEWTDLFSSNGKGRIAATYDYVDENGKLLFQAVRFEPKDFRQRRPDGAGDWEWNLNGTRRVLYRLPKVLEAVEAGRRVWVVEGEKDVHALERAGEVATCNPGGADKWRKEYGKPLRGATVAIIADTDKAGRRHARAVAEALEGVAATVKVGEPAEGKDAADHLKAGRGLDEFVELTAEELLEGPKGRRARLTPASSIRSQRVRWLARERIPLCGLTVVAGEKGLGNRSTRTATCRPS
jgi:5S rRNA maturation endonuclease (ribonuclease M5)